MEKKPRAKIITSYGRKFVGSDRRWLEDERMDAINYFKGIIDATTGAEREGALNVYVALLEGLTICDDDFPYTDIQPYSMRKKSDKRIYYLGNVQGQLLSGEREARMIFPNKADALSGIEHLDFISGEEWEIERECGETRVPNYTKLLADVGLSAKTVYCNIEDEE